jgi:hypothetical protein
MNYWYFQSIAHGMRAAVSLRMNHRIACLIALGSALSGCLNSIGEGAAEPEPPLVATAHPPVRPSAVANGGSTRFFVVTKVKLGITDQKGVVSPKAWGTYGYDLDGRWTTEEESKTSLRSCVRAKDSYSKTLVDGDGGVDNNFGQHFMSIVKSLKSDVEEVVNQQLDDGSGATMILRLDNVGAANNASVPGALFRTAPGTALDAGHLPIDDRSLDASGAPLVRFPKGYMANGTWVSGDGDAEFSVVFPSLTKDVIAEIPLVAGFITLDVETGKNGVFAGASLPDRFETALKPSFEAMGVCDGNATSEQVWATVHQEVDLALGTTNPEASNCNAISVGIGFEVKPTTEPGAAVHVESPKREDDCGK